MEAPPCNQHGTVQSGNCPFDRAAALPAYGIQEFRQLRKLILPQCGLGVVIAGASTYGILWHLMFFLFGEFDPEDQQNGYTATKAEDAHGCKSAAYQKISHMGHVPQISNQRSGKSLVKPQPRNWLSRGFTAFWGVIGGVYLRFLRPLHLGSELGANHWGIIQRATTLMSLSSTRSMLACHAYDPSTQLSVTHGFDHLTLQSTNQLRWLLGAPPKICVLPVARRKFLRSVLLR